MPSAADRTTDPDRARRAFLLMPFSPEFGWLRDEITAAGHETGVLVERADNIFRAGVIIDQVEEYMRAADVVIAVCTGKNANVFYELGIARPHHEAILIAEGTDDLPFDVRHYRAQLYGGTSPEDSRATLRQRVREAIEQTIDARAAQGAAPSPPTIAPNLEARRTAYRNWLQFTENLGTWSFAPGADPARFLERLHDAKAELDLVASTPVLDAVQHYIDSLEVGLAAIQEATQGVTDRQDQMHRAGAAFGRAMEEPDRRVRQAMRNDIGVDS
jgi:hypothetical protein